MNTRFAILGLIVIALLNGCATSNSVKEDSSEIWGKTKKVSKEAWYGTQEVSKEAWHGTKEISNDVWHDSKKAVHNATAE